MLWKTYRFLLRLPPFKGKSLLERILRKSFSAPIMMVKEDLLMELDPLEWLQVSLIKDKILEPQTVELYDRILNPGDTYIDVGAHVGYHCLRARRAVGSEGRVIAVEPQPYNCQKILKNFSLNGFENIALYVGVASEDSGSVFLHKQKETDTSRLTVSLEAVNDLPQRFSVRRFPLQELIRDEKLKQIKLLKIDAEGAELEVLNGLRDSIMTIENIILEILDASCSSERGSALVDCLQANGFTLKSVTGRLWTLGEYLPERNLWASRA